MDENSISLPYLWFDYDPIQNDMFVDKKCYLHRTELATKMGGVFVLITFLCDSCGFKPLKSEDILAHISVYKLQPYVVKLDHKVFYDKNNRMLLDVGVSATKVTDEDYDDPSDAFAPYADENFDDLENIADEDIENDNFNNETSVNFNDDVSKIAINDILNEMRMGSPIENDLLNDLLSDEATNNFHQFGNGDLEGFTINPDPFDGYNFNQNEDLKEQNAEVITTDSNLLDQLLYPESCSTPDVQVEFNDEVQFQYDASDQFNCEPDITLSYPEEPNSTAVAVEDNNGLSFLVNYNTNSQPHYDLASYLNKAETNSNNQYFECSTNLPMTPEELQDDIQKYLNSEQNNSYASFYEFADMMNNTSDKQDDNKFDFPYNSEMLQEYISEQNQLLQSLDPINPVDSFVTPNVASSEQYKVYQCNVCSFYTQSLHGLSVHMRVHSQGHLSCTECKFTTTKAYNLRQHQAYGHGTAYCCQTCDYITHSSSKIRSHLRREH